MDHCAIQQSTLSACDEMKCSGFISASDRRETVVCPKPRRVGVLNPTITSNGFRSLRWHVRQHELYESNAEADIIDIILTKGGCGEEQASTQVASSPPFFSGSPPSRVSNPLTQDARFQDGFIITQPSLLSPVPAPSAPSSSPSSTRKGGCVRANFGNNPAVRIEGFDCLDRDRRNCSIPALA